VAVEHPELQARLWLALSEGMTGKIRAGIYQRHGSYQAAFHAFPQGFDELVGPKTREELSQLKAAGVERLQIRLKQLDIQVAYLEHSPGYPALLSCITDAPDVLFYRGTLQGPEVRAVAMVGSRRETRYGRKQAFNIARDLARQGIAVISGLARGIDTGEQIYLDLKETSELCPITDDMALCHSSFQQAGKKLVVKDAENGWFLRINHITSYGTDPFYEKLSIHPGEPLFFFNLQGTPGSTCLIWEHTLDSTGEPCPNPRVIMRIGSLATFQSAIPTLISSIVLSADIDAYPPHKLFFLSHSCLPGLLEGPGICAKIKCYHRRRLLAKDHISSATCRVRELI